MLKTEKFKTIAYRLLDPAHAQTHTPEPTLTLADTYIYIHTHTETQAQTEALTHILTDRHTDRHIDRQMFSDIKYKNHVFETIAYRAPSVSHTHIHT